MPRNYGKRSTYAKKSAYRRPSAGRSYTKRRRTMGGGSFASQVKKANLTQAQEKNVSVCFMNHALKHNSWSKGDTVTLPADASGKSGTCPAFENMFTQISHGTGDHQRVGDEIYVSRMSLRIFLSSLKTSPCVTYRIVVYTTANLVPGSSGAPTLLKDNLDSNGINNLLRSVDKRGAHVLYEKLIAPGKNGLLGDGVNATSQIENINIPIKRNVNFQSVAVTFGSKGSWTNLHVAVLAYDGNMQAISHTNAAMEVEKTEGLAAGVGGTQATISTTAIGALGCEYTLYFKEA